MRDAAQAECQREHVPAFGAVEYVSEQHMRAAGLKEPGFRKGHAKFVTTVWLARSWTKATCWPRWSSAASTASAFAAWRRRRSGYFGRSVDQLTLPQAATLAAFVGGEGPDPWCDPASTASMRHRVLGEMRANNAIDEPAFDAADRSDLQLTAPPADRQPCRD